MRKITSLLMLCLMAFGLTAYAQTAVSAETLNALTEATDIQVRNISPTNRWYFCGDKNVESNTDAESVLVWEPAGDGNFYLKKKNPTGTQGEGYLQTSAPSNMGDKATAQKFTAVYAYPTDAPEAGADDTNLVRFSCVNDNAGKWINCQATTGKPVYNSGAGAWTMHNVYIVAAATPEPGISTSKEYRIKDVASSKYMNASNYDAHASGPVGGVNFVDKAESDDQIFTFEEDGTNYKLKTKSGKYIYCQPWNVDALAEGSALTFVDNGDGTYYIMNGSKYFKVENVSGVFYPYCDADEGAAAKFIVEDITVAPDPEPEPVVVTELAQLSNNKVYTILNARNASGILYHPSAANAVSWNGRNGYKDIAYNAATTNYQWAIYKSDKGKYYIYNLEAQKFVGTTEEKDAAIPLTETVTNSIEITKRSNVSGFPFMMSQAGAPHIINTSPNHQSGAINWNGGYSDTNDAGNSFVFHEVADLDAAVLSVIKTAVDTYENAMPELPYTPITSAADLDNTKAYVIIPQDASRGAFYATSTSANLTSTKKAEATFDVTDKNQQFAIVTHNGKSYLYSLGAEKFVHDGGGQFAPLTEAPQSFVALNEEAAGYFSVKLNGSECINVANGYDEGCVLNWNSIDGGNQYQVAAIKDVTFDPAEVLVMIQNYEGALTAEGILASYDGVGYPVDSERELLATAAANSKADCKSTTNLAALAAAAESYKSTSNVKMPEDGKAYTFKNVQKDGTTFYFACDATTGVYMSENEADACTFVCKVVGDKYVFVNNNGQYLAVKGSSAGTNGNKGFTEAYDQTAGKFFNDFTITKLTPSNVATDGNTDAIAVTNELLFGYVGLATQRTDRNELIYFVIKNDKGFDQANAPFCRHNLTSMVKITEVEYPNKPVVNGTDDVDGVAAISTFCAPFATVAPNNVDVYIAASDESHYIKLQKVEGAVPANTGVVLVSEDNALAGQAIAMVPATTEALADVTGNLLRGDAANGDYTVDAAVNAYVLGAVDGVAGFYPLSATDRTIKQGKAYLVLESSLSAVKLYFGGDDATGIESVVKTENANAPIFDLSGRRVVNVAKGGIYIQNGKKFIVK